MSEADPHAWHWPGPSPLALARPAFDSLDVVPIHIRVHEANGDTIRVKHRRDLGGLGLKGSERQQLDSTSWYNLAIIKLDTLSRRKPIAAPAS